jgi:hypothetical protein
MKTILGHREGMKAIGNYSLEQKSLIVSTTKEVRHYIGTLEITGIARGTVCLLEDGRILTCLHNILDYGALNERKAELIDFEAYDVSVYFVKDDKIFKYKINSAPITGINHLRAKGVNSWCFDYAFLELEGNPVLDIGGGLKLDKTTHFGQASVTDPAKTLAISGPFIQIAEDGKLKAYRYVSLSENQLAAGSFYNIAQGGDHPSAPGFSGMGIVGVGHGYKSDTLYALHSYRDNQHQQGGVKISEILISVRQNVSASRSSFLDHVVVDLIQDWFERLTTAKRNANGSVTRGKNEISFDEAVKILLQGGDIAGDNKAEAAAPARKAWGRIITDQPHQPLGWPHHHHHQRASTGHAFYPGDVQRKEMAAKEQKVKEQEERRQKQIADTQAKKAESKAGHIQISR